MILLSVTCCELATLPMINLPCVQKSMSLVKFEKCFCTELRLNNVLCFQRKYPFQAGVRATVSSEVGDRSEHSGSLAIRQTREFLVDLFIYYRYSCGIIPFIFLIYVT